MHAIVVHFEDGHKALLNRYVSIKEAKQVLFGSKPVDFYPGRPHRLVIESPLRAKEAKRLLGLKRRAAKGSVPKGYSALRKKELLAMVESLAILKRGLVGWYEPEENGH